VLAYIEHYRGVVKGDKVLTLLLLLPALLLRLLLLVSCTAGTCWRTLSTTAAW
jgi:hypothetical protein